MTSPRVSIIVCTRNRPHEIEPCVRSLLAQTYADRELIVVDQSTSDDTRHIVETLGQAVRHHRTPTVGLSRARNLGIRISRGEILAFTDDDVIAAPDWIEKLTEDYDRHPEVEIVFGRVLPLDETDGQRTFCVRDTPEYRLHSHKSLIPYGFGGGNNMTFRRTALDRIGFFDERFGAGSRLKGAEDVDFIYRAFLAGMDILYSPRAVVSHRQWRDDEETDRATRGYNLANGALVAKHLLARHRGSIRILCHRFWHHALSAIPSGIRRMDSRRIRSGMTALLDHLRGVFAYLQSGD